MKWVYVDEDYSAPEGYEDAAIVIDFSQLKGHEFSDFVEDMKIVDTFEYRPDVDWDFYKKFVKVTGWISEEESYKLYKVYDETYNLPAYDN